MSDEYHRPTYTTRDLHGSFNATQVRLYGIPGVRSEMPPEEEENVNKKKKKKQQENDREQKPKVVSGILGDAFLIAAQYKGEETVDSEFIEYIRRNVGPYFTPSKSSYVFIDAIIKRFKIMFGAIDLDPNNDSEKVMTSGIIFGYAYEGHSYDFPKPKIMLIPTEPEEVFPVDDSGYYAKRYANYAVWIVDKLDQCIEIEVNQGFVEQLVLEANLPGKRSPNMYAGKYLMGHRGGRLTE